MYDTFGALQCAKPKKTTTKDLIMTQIIELPQRASVESYASPDEQKVLSHKFPLRHELRMMGGLPPFPKSLVKKYQDKVESDAKNPKIQKPRPAIAIAYWIAVGAALLSAISCRGANADVLIIRSAALGLSLFIAGLVRMSFYPENDSPRTDAKWERLTLQEYIKEFPRMPGTVRQKLEEDAAEMAARLPDAVPFIEYFERDPFFGYTHLNKATGWIETEYRYFWNESGFLA